MANATIRFRIEGIDDIRRGFRELSLQFARIKACAKLRRAYLNVLRSTRRTRKEKVRKWELAKLHAYVAGLRVKHPDAEVRLGSRFSCSGMRFVAIEIIYARGQTQPSVVDRRTILLGHKTKVVEIDEVPV